MCNIKTSSIEQCYIDEKRCYKERLGVRKGRSSHGGECQCLVSTLHFAHNCILSSVLHNHIRLAHKNSHCGRQRVVASSTVLAMSPAVEVVAKRRSQQGWWCWWCWRCWRCWWCWWWRWGAVQVGGGEGWHVQLLPESAGGEGRSWRGGRGGGSSKGALVVTSARAAWCAAARWLRRTLARGPRRRRWRPGDVEEDSEEGAGVVPISSFNLVLPPMVATDKLACPQAFSILWKTSSKKVSSSPIFASESEVWKDFQGAQELSSFHFQSKDQWSMIVNVFILVLDTKCTLVNRKDLNFHFPYQFGRVHNITRMSSEQALTQCTLFNAN